MSSEDLESLIVSDESLLDPSIDTSRLKKTTDTRQELLGDLQPGLQYDPTLQSTYSDLLRYFSGDLNLAPAPVSTVTTPTVGSPTDEGGGGGGTIGTGSGGQATITDPTITSPTTQPIDPSGMLPQISTTLQDLGTPTAIDPSSMLPQISTTQPIDPSSMLPQISETQQESALSEAFRKGKEALDSGVQTISQVGQSIADSVQGTYNDLNKTINVPGLGDIDVGKTLGGLAVNALVGAPVSFVKAVMDQIPPSASQLAYDAYTPTQQAIVDKEFGPGGLLDGYNEVSAFGKDAKGIAEDVLDQRLDNVGIDQRTLDLADLVDSLGGDVPSSIESTLSGDINPDGIGDASVAEAIAAADRAAAQAAAEAAEIDRQQREADAAEAAAQAARDAIRERDLGTGPQFSSGDGDGGNGGGGGYGTHVCTASYANNLITVLDFKSLKKYGIKLRRNDKYLMKAYDWFGPKLAAAVKKGKLVNFAKHSTSMWKYEQTKEDVSFKIKFMSRFHKIITRPILRSLGALLTIKEKLTK